MPLSRLFPFAIGLGCITLADIFLLIPTRSPGDQVATLLLTGFFSVVGIIVCVITLVNEAKAARNEPGAGAEAAAGRRLGLLGRWALLAVLCLPLLYWVVDYLTWRRTVPATSVVVLEFEPDGFESDPLPKDVAKQLTDGVMKRLSADARLQVQRSTAVERPLDAGREASARAILKGRVYAYRPTVIVYAELFETKTGWKLWGSDAEPPTQRRQFSRAVEKTGNDPDENVIKWAEHLSQDIADMVRNRLAVGR